MTDTEKTLIADTMQYSIDHLNRIAEDIRKETEEREISYYLQEAKATAELMRWELDSRIRKLARNKKTSPADFRRPAGMN